MIDVYESVDEEELEIFLEDIQRQEEEEKQAIIDQKLEAAALLRKVRYIPSAYPR